MSGLRLRTAHIFRALRSRNFRLFFVGQGISLVGTWIQHIAMSWLVYRLTLSPVMLGVVSFSGQFPSFILSPLAGVWADKWNRHKILLVTQSLAMLQALLLTMLTYTGQIEVWQLVALSIFLGCINSIDIPARQSFLIELVEEKKFLSNAIALNSLMFNAARLVGPAIAGLLLAYTSEAGCFLLNTLSFSAVLLSLMAIRLGRVEPQREGAPVWERLREGVRYAFGFAPIRRILMLLGAINLIGTGYAVLLPVFAREVLRGGSGTYGSLVTSAGVGALLATVLLAARKNVLGQARMIGIGAALFGAGLATVSATNEIWQCVPLFVLIGYALISCTASCNIILQTVVEDDKRGRVMSFYTMAFMGTMPIGSLLAGIVADWLGVGQTLVLQGVCGIGIAVLFMLQLPSFHESVHTVYRKNGIIPAETPPGVGV